MKKKTLIVNYSSMTVGGIEVAFARLINYSLKKGYRVIWLSTPNTDRDSSFKETTNNPMLEKVYVKRGRTWLPHKKIEFDKEEDVTIITCEPLDFVKGEKIRRYAKNCASINHFLILPHFTGSAYYPERFFRSKTMQKIWKKIIAKKVALWVKNDCIRAFSRKHLDKYEENYGVVISDKVDKVMKWPNQMPELSEEQLQKRAEERTEKFNIITCSRFDFPHKGYILGLIDDFALLKPVYPQIQLIVVGYGQGENDIQSKITNLPGNIQNSIVLTGVLHPERLKEEFSECHLNIGLAGALGKGAECALPSLLVRHYSEKCETYGFISDCGDNVLRSDPGEDVKPFIQDMIECPNEKYIEQAKRDYDKIANRRIDDPEYIFRQVNKNCEVTIGCLEEIIWKILNFCIYTKVKFFKNKAYDEK